MASSAIMQALFDAAWIAWCRGQDAQRIESARIYARSGRSDRQVAVEYPDVVQAAVKRSHWERIKPEVTE